jgi:hypothetical protein
VVTRLLFVSFLVACGSRQPAPVANSEPGSPAGQLPAEVKTLLERWENCWHFSGEEPTDDARAKEIRDAQDKWCPGNEQERERLRVKWQDRTDVQDALRKLDEMQ